MKQATYHSGPRNYGTGFDMMKRINELEAENAGLRKMLGNTVAMLDALVTESGRGVEYGEEDSFRMGEWFEAEDIAQIEAARAALSTAPVGEA